MIVSVIYPVKIPFSAGSPALPGENTGSLSYQPDKTPGRGERPLRIPLDAPPSVEPPRGCWQRSPQAARRGVLGGGTIFKLSTGDDPLTTMQDEFAQMLQGQMVALCDHLSFPVNPK
jgi:hypothetical protein